MKERPILIGGAMVGAILDGQKTQTRRVVKGFPLEVLTAGEFSAEYVALPENNFCPYGNPGDRLWVRETWSGCWGPALPGHGKIVTDAYVLQRDGSAAYATKQNPLQVFYKEYRPTPMPHIKWKPSIHMPRWASRINLEIVSVRIERLQDISETDAAAEGIIEYEDGLGFGAGWPDVDTLSAFTPVAAFANLWDSINANRAPWSCNPFVWVIEFKGVG